MANKAFELREFFHLTFLRHFSYRLTGRAYAVKGGICLRFFHGSPRLSEDMDLDVLSRIGVGTLQKAVDTVLGSGALASSLAVEGILGVSATKPKQTTTTQRWKVTLRLQGDPLQTKIEFSRRSDQLQYQTGVPNSEILSQYKCSLFAAQFYDGGQVAGQKIGALAASGRNVVRDLFDLHHLIFVMSVDLAKATKGMKKKELESAIEKIEGFSFKDFVEQVRPYLTEELVAAYNDPASFERMKNETSGKLLERLS